MGLHTRRDVGPSGSLSLNVIPGTKGSPGFGAYGISRPTLAQALKLGAPRLGLDPAVNRYRRRNWRNLRRGLRDVWLASKMDAPVLQGFLHLAHISPRFGRRELGLVGCRVVTTAWAGLLVDGLIADNDMSNHNFHGIGTNNTAEAVGDTDLNTEITTQYDTDNTRPSGTQVEASPVIYRTVGNVLVDAAVAAVEHGIFDNATVGSGLLMDRTVFAVVNLADGDTLAATYELSINAGS